MGGLWCLSRTPATVYVEFGSPSPLRLFVFASRSPTPLPNERGPCPTTSHLGALPKFMMGSASTPTCLATPYLPWNRWWWTRMFDAGVKVDPHWPVRKQFRLHQLGLGGAEARRLRDCAGSGRLRRLAGRQRRQGSGAVACTAIPCTPGPPERSRIRFRPQPGSFPQRRPQPLLDLLASHRRPSRLRRSSSMCSWMVDHFRGRIHYYALVERAGHRLLESLGQPGEFGRLLKAFIPAVHEADPDAKVIYGGQADPNARFRPARA